MQNGYLKKKNSKENRFTSSLKKLKQKKSTKKLL